ncbi:hypothetical protein [Reyranella sp.]|uniref:hypothetical protein n=1 Tax=Reyranella sp. TaxID=1929291 RepID=UPI003BAB886C
MTQRVWRLTGLAWAFLWGAHASGVAPSAAQEAAPCSLQYLLQNDPAYWSEASYTVNVKCVQALRAELKTLSVPTSESRYLKLHLGLWDGDKAVITAGLTALCRDTSYARACSAAANLMLNERLGSETETIQLLEMAAAGRMPAADISLGDLYLLRFRISRDSRDLCRAYTFWQTGAALGDPDGGRRLDWVQSELKPNCAES